MIHGLMGLIVAGALGLVSPGSGKREEGSELHPGARISASPVLSSSHFPLPPSQAVPDSGSNLTIYLMTMGYGDLVWERFGHNAIRIVDAANGTDSVYNWGTFDFAQPNFLRRFLTGNTLYWMQGDGMAETMDRYRYLNRSVWLQELDLTPAQRLAVRAFITWNARPENQYYRYDYYLDNCSTRVRDLIDRIVGGRLKAAMFERLTTTTYRFHTQRSLAFDRTVALGTDIGLGEVADRRLSQWEEAFLPTRLQQHVRGVQILAPDGKLRPLVKSEQQVFAASRAPEPTEPPDYRLRNLLIGIAIALPLVLLAWRARSGHRSTRLAFVTAASTWSALNGILGIVLIVGWAATRHTYMARNENILQFDPLSVVLAVLLPMAIMRGRALNATRLLATVVAAVAVVGLAMKLVPVFNQTNLAAIGLALPSHLALAWAARVLTAQSVAVPAPPSASARAAAPRSAA